MNFAKSPDKLVPAIIQDNTTRNVLMLGYMNEEALQQTKTTQRVTFYSRSKKRLWVKGESSGNFLNVVELLEDCDEDTLLIKVNPIRNTCHKGTDTCFGSENKENFLSELQGIIKSRKLSPNKNSYTSQLFKSGINKIAQKVGEEAVELIIEAKDNNIELFKNEAADLVFHLLILLETKELGLRDIEQILKMRHL